MSYYQPSQDKLRFVYDKKLKNVCIKNQVTATVDTKETLTKDKLEYIDATKTVLKEYGHGRDESQLKPHDYLDDSAVEIMNKVNIPYDEHNQEAFRGELRKVLADNYEVKAKVKDKPDGSATGGQATNTISKNDQIEIV